MEAESNLPYEASIARHVLIVQYVTILDIPCCCRNLDLCHGSLSLAPCDRSTSLPSSLPLVAFAEVVTEFMMSQRTFNEANALHISGRGGSRYCLELASLTALTVMRGMMFVFSVRLCSWC